MKFYQYINENTKDQPSVRICNDGSREWRLPNGRLHNLNGPSIITPDGNKFWYKNNQLHRLGGPAAEYSNGTKEWYENDHRHRIDGPALIWSDGRKDWYYEGEEVDQSIDIPEQLQLAMFEDDPENINKIGNPVRKLLKYMIENYPWKITDQMFSRCPDECEDLKEKWSRIGKARKQIGL